MAQAPWQESSVLVRMKIEQQVTRDAVHSIITRAREDSIVKVRTQYDAFSKQIQEENSKFLERMTSWISEDGNGFASNGGGMQKSCNSETRVARLSGGFDNKLASMSPVEAIPLTDVKSLSLDSRDIIGSSASTKVLKKAISLDVVKAVAFGGPATSPSPRPDVRSSITSDYSPAGESASKTWRSARANIEPTSERPNRKRRQMVADAAHTNCDSHSAAAEHSMEALGKCEETSSGKRMLSRRNTSEVTAAGRQSKVSVSTKFGRQSKRASIFPERPGRSMFQSNDEMKDKVKQALLYHPYNVTDFYKKTGLAQTIARSSAFEFTTLAVVAFNAIWIAVELDYNTSEVLSQAEPHFQIAEHGFCAYFCFEILARYCAFTRTQDALKDAWFVFDAMLVSLMVLETWLMSTIIAITMAGGDGNAEAPVDSSLLRLLRLIRLARMARMARLLRWMPELVILLKGLFLASRSVFFTLVLLVLTIYIFALVFRQLTNGTAIGEQYFVTVPKSMSSLLLRGTLPDLSEWVDDMSNEHPLYAVLVLFFILVASLTVMNMLVGVLVEVVANVSTVENEALVIQRVRLTMLQMIEDLGMDLDGDGSISKTEFESLLVNPDAAQFIQGVGVDVVGLVEFSDFIFNKKELSFPEFVELILQLRGTNTATVRDVVDMRKQVMQEFDVVEADISSLVELVELLGDFLQTTHLQVLKVGAPKQSTLLEKGSWKKAGSLRVNNCIRPMTPEGSKEPFEVDKDIEVEYTLDTPEAPAPLPSLVHDKVAWGQPAPPGWSVGPEDSMMRTALDTWEV